MTSKPSDPSPSSSPISLAGFRTWLVRALAGEQLEYHRGLLIWDRSPGSDLADDGRRALAGVADAALQAAEDGLVYLVQRRNDAFDFSYIAIKTGTIACLDFAQPQHAAALTMPAAA